jgi:photosystem II stability/assembly factor-like uncharacterized protein
MLKRLAICGLLGVLALWGLVSHRTGRVRQHLAGPMRVLPSPAPQRNMELKPIRKYHEVARPKRLDAWTIIGPGGGGTFHHPAISPFDPNLVFVSTDMTGCFVSEDGGLTWREFNLRMTCSFTFDPKRPETVYARAGGGGIWRSDDRGHTWNIVYPDSTAKPIMYVDDEAEPWILPSHGWGVMTAMEVDPEDSGTLFGIVEDSLKISTDSGKSWKVLAQGVNGNRIYVDPLSPRGNRTVIITRGDSTSVWDGKTLTPKLKVPNSAWVYGFTFGSGGKLGKSMLYSANDYIVKDGVLIGGGLLASEDGGRNWRSLNEGLLKLAGKGTYPQFTAIGTSLRHPEVIYASIYYWNPADDPEHRYFGVIKTVDGGKTWSVVTKENNFNAESMHDSWVGWRFGPDWGDQPLDFGVDENNPDLVYRTDLGRLMRSKDGGKNWDAVYSQGTDQGYTTTGLDVTTCYGLHFDPFDPKRMFISYTDIGLFRSEDGGASWISSTGQGVPPDWVNTTYWLEFDPAVKGKMWAVMSRLHDMPRMRMLRKVNGKGGVVVSTDGGKSWAASNQGMPEMVATHILLDPKSPPAARVLYVTGIGRGVFKSTDGGKSWTLRNEGLPDNPYTWRMAIDRDGTLYVVTIRRSTDGVAGSAGDGAVYRSRNGAESWERMKLPGGVNGPVSITPDPDDAGRLYLSAWGRYKLYQTINPPDGGVFLTTDGGASWKNVMNGSRRVYDVTVDRRDHNIVYAAGFDASAWRSADRGKTWTRIRGFNFKNGHRVIPDPLDASKIYIATFGSSVWHGPAEGDPKAMEDIVSPPHIRFSEPLR